MESLNEKIIELDAHPADSHDDPLYKYKVHRILAHSYFLYFFLFLVGVSLDVIFKIKLITSDILAPVGVTLLFFSTFLIFWAQHTSRNLHTNKISKENFCRGPYCYTRSPTHWGLCLLLLSFGIIANAVFVVLCTVLAFLISKFIFLREEEKILAEKYGEPYLEYKKSVRL
ncbi:MAG: methyltransferase [bacterium]|nr:methyltransferase [bacterium]